MNAGKRSRMSDVYQFRSKKGRTANENLNAFVSMCRFDLTAFGTDLDWDSWKWPGAHFTKLGTPSQKASDDDALDPNFADFAKAYFRYKQSHRPASAKWELCALKAMEKALCESGGDAKANNLTVRTMDEAAVMARRQYSASSAYHVGRELQRVAQFVSENALIETDLTSWKSPIRRRPDETIQIGQKAKAKSERKLPNSEAIDALAEIFANDPKEARDIFSSSLFAMSLCAPSRVSELLELPEDCEVHDTDRDGNPTYGWRFRAGKDFGDDVKWIPTEMVPTARTAVARVRQLTEEARRLARWIEIGADRYFRHERCPKVGDDVPLTSYQALEALGLAFNGKGHPFSHLTQYGLNGRHGAYTLTSLWVEVLKRQPADFPVFSERSGLRFSEALFCMQKNLLNSQKGTSPVILWRPSGGVFNSDLDTSRGNGVSIFHRHGYKSKEGQEFKVTSNQARHLLNTIAQRGGLSQSTIARWSGRAEPKQNRVYNHMTDFEMVERAVAFDESQSFFGPLKQFHVSAPATTQEFNLQEKGASHITEYGFCLHDYTMSPCEMHRDCLNCMEQVCVKGDDEKLKRIRTMLAYVEEQYQQSVEAIDDGLAGADRWHEYHQTTRLRIRELVEILENPEVEDGAIVRLKNPRQFDPLKRAISSSKGLPRATCIRDETSKTS